MSQTDPIAELLTRIRNAMRARYNELTVPHSRLREAICRVLMAEGFLGGVEVGGEAGMKPELEFALGPLDFKRPAGDGSLDAFIEMNRQSSYPRHR